jgi:hypothetical protein
MIAFKNCLDDETCGGLKDLSLGLGHTCRISLGKSWGYEVEQLQGEYHMLIKKYFEKKRRADTAP